MRQRGIIIVVGRLLFFAGLFILITGLIGLFVGDPLGAAVLAVFGVLVLVLSWIMGGLTGAGHVDPPTPLDIDDDLLP